MAFNGCDGQPSRSTKLVVSGGFGSGKTTFVGAVSEIVPLRTEAVMTSVSAGVDDLSATPDKTTTTVAMDSAGSASTPSWCFTCSGPRPESVLVHVGRPRARCDRRGGARGHQASGGLLRAGRLLRSTRAAVRRRDQRVRRAARHRPEEVREALQLGPHVPVVVCDARERDSAKETLIALVEHALNTWATV